ncbi:STAS domain-containing protein [Actinomycetospora sp. CA-101289]|uniref:STAS domain-containing protein n=1 Tax=Actinomycetospora sp. CA-101289 TaxID=3239893 RepID=UPI003D96D0EB
MAQGVHEPSTPTSGDPPPDRHPQPGVELSYTGDRPTVTVTGQVDRAKTGEVSGTVRGLLAVGVSELVVDLTHAWDSAALLTVLARTRAELADHGGSLRLVGVALPEFLAALNAAPLDEVFLVYDAVRRRADDDPHARERPTTSVQRRTDWST